MNVQQRQPRLAVVAAARDPYAPPRAGLNADASGTRMYSPTQAALGAFLGGPVGLTYFLWANFRTLANEEAARWTLAAGAALMTVLVVLSPMLPERMPGWPITLVYVLTARFVAEKMQLTKEAIASSSQYTFHSGWRVFGIGLLCLLVSLALIVGPLLALAFLGIWDPMGVMQAA
jgi:hypothetical protein